MHIASANLLAQQRPLLTEHVGWIVAGIIVVIGLFLIGRKDLARFSMRRAWAVASVSFHESIRRRVLWITPLAIIGVIITAQLQRPLDEQDAIRQTIKFAIFASGLLVAVTAIILACTNLPREIESRVIYTIVTKPMTRLEIVLGKVMGFAGISAAILLIMGIFTFGYLHLRAGLLRQDIQARLEAGVASPTEVATLQHYLKVGLLNAKALDFAENLQIYGRAPDEQGALRWFSGGGANDAVVPFAIEADETIPPDAPGAGPGAAGLVVSLRIGYEVNQAGVVAEEDNLPVGVAAPDADRRSPTEPPSVNVQILDRHLYSLVTADQITNGTKAQLRDPQGREPIMVHVPPAQINRLINEPIFYVHILGANPGYHYSLRNDSVQLMIPGARPGVMSDPIGQLTPSDAVAYQGVRESVPIFRGRTGSIGQQLRGGAHEVGGVAIFRFRGTPPATTGGGVPLELRAGIEGSPEDEEDEEAATVVELVIHDRTTSTDSEPIQTLIESNRSAFVQVPATSLQSGDFDVRVRCLTLGRYLGLASDSVAIVQGHQSFGFNLLKSLSILWLMATLVVTIGIFCSTFLSWPIAIVLTLLILLGHWGVAQLGDALQPGVGRSVATDLGFQSPGQTQVVSVTIEALSRSLDMFSRVLPDISRFAAAEDLERGLAIPWVRMWESLAVVLLFGVPLLILGYIILRNKEVAP
jgi:hypothetical protein